MVVLGGKVYVIGGFDGLQRINNVETYDPFHNCWSEVSEVTSVGNSACIMTSKLKEGHMSMLVYGFLITRLPLRTFLVAVSFPPHSNHCFSIADQVITALCTPALSWPEPQMCGGGWILLWVHFWAHSLCVLRCHLLSSSSHGTPKDPFRTPFVGGRVIW